MTKYILLFIIYTCGNNFANAQVTISGPTCVLTATEYQYNFSATWDTAANFTVCINGGKLAGTVDSCYTGKPIPYIRVIWNRPANTGTISVTSLEGAQALQTTFTDLLFEGELDSATRYQFLDSLTVPSTIMCASASGGACSPNYVYQWQKSTDFTDWEDIDGATGLNLSFTTSFEVTTYYRRRVTDMASSTIVYTNGAAVFITQFPQQ